MVNLRQKQLIDLQEAASTLASLRADPEHFHRGVLGSTTHYSKQLEMMKAVLDHRRVAVVGCNSCVAPETRVWDPLRCEGVPIAEFSGERVQSVRGVLSPVSLIWRKGEADLYRVRLSNGAEFVATLDHKVLTPAGWRPLRALRVGVPIAVSPIGSSSLSSQGDASDHTTPGPCDPHCSSRVGGSQGGCHSSHRSGGGRLLLASDSDPESAPSRYDALGHSPPYLQTDGWGDRAGYSRPDPRYVHLTKTGYVQVPVHSYGAGLFPGASSSSGLSTWVSLVAPLASHFPALRSLEVDSLGSFQYPHSNYNPQWARIDSVWWERYGEYWDMMVPGEHNYLAEGVFHHNSGKDWEAGRILLWWMLTNSPAVCVVIGPTHRQVHEIVWREARAAYYAARVPIGGRMFRTSHFEVSPNHYAIGFATSDEFNIQGFHCLTPDHEILTKRGFIPIDEVTDDDFALTLQVLSSMARWSPVIAHYKYSVKDQPINIYESKSVSFAVTDEHRFLTKTRPGRRGWKLKPFSSLGSQFRVRRLNTWKSSQTHMMRGTRLPSIAVELGFSPEDWAAFIGWWIAEGSVSKLRYQRLRQEHWARDYHHSKFYEVSVWQTKESGRSMLRSLLVPRGFIEYDDHFSISNRRLGDWLRKNCGRYSHERHIPRVLKDAKMPILSTLLNAVIDGDGHRRGVNQGDTVWTVSKQLADDLQEISIKLGRPATIGSNHTNHPLGKTRRECFSISIPLIVQDHLVIKSRIERLLYTGDVHCISTRDGNFLVRRKGKVFWSGNSPNLLVILTEAHNIPQTHIEAVKRLNPSRILMTGNPLSTEGEFYSAFHENQDSWHTINISAFDTPNIQQGKIVVPGMVTLEDVEERRRDWGENSYLYVAGVLGQFPDSLEDVVVPLVLIRASVERAKDLLQKGPLSPGPVLACDVARFGEDRTVVYGRWVGAGGVSYARKLRTLQGADTMAVTGMLVGFWQDYGATMVVVDDGGVGGGVVDRLREQQVPVQPFNFGGKARRPDRFADAGTEAWYNIREMMQKELLAIQEDAPTMAQLSGRKHQVQSDGRLRLEPKELMRKRGTRSPDEADALAMACWGAGSSALQVW